MKILHIDQNHPILIEQLNALGCENVEAYRLTKPEIEAIIADFEGIVIRSRITIDVSLLEKAPRLKFIARVGAGLESIDLNVAQQCGIKLIAAPEGNRNAVGEHTLGMLLSLFNHLNKADREVRKGLWLREANRGVELSGKTVGLIGYGNMGKAFAQKLCGFDCKVIFYDITEGLEDENARQVSLQELQKESDVVSLHTPWTPLTDKMVNQSFIDAFQKSFWLLNTARGKSVVTKDLVAALQSGKVLGAGLDVLEYEQSSFESLFSSELPKPLQNLLAMDNVILSPHIAGWTLESKEKLARVIVDKIKQCFY